MVRPAMFWCVSGRVVVDLQVVYMLLAKIDAFCCCGQANMLALWMEAVLHSSSCLAQAGL